MILLLFLLFTSILGAWAYQENRKVKQQRQIIITGGITLALIATILTIISAIISIIVCLYQFFEDDLWWYF